MSTELFAIYAVDHPDSHEKRPSLREAHLSRLRLLQEAARLTMAGPLSDLNGKVQGSLIIAKFTNLDEAENWFQQDPYVLAGVYQSVTIRPFKQVLPE